MRTFQPASSGFYFGKCFNHPRYDLIPNPVETAKGYLKYERETLENFQPAELVRATSAALHCPLPPLFAQSNL